MKELFIAFTLITLMSGAAWASEAPAVKYIDAPKFENQIYLYGEPNKADVDFEQWYEIENRGQFVRNVKVPTLIPYLPEKENSNGAAIIIAPGGAFLHHTFGSGGYEAAEWFKKQGFATFILKYRVEITPREEADYQAYVAEKMAGYRAGGLSGNYAPATPNYAFEDINAAVKLLRTRAKEFNIKPDKIGIVGFSAGALMAVYNAESAEPECKADFIASIYGQLVMREMPEKLPPMFAAMSSDDELSGQSGFEIIQAWQKRGIVELHLYGKGGHNFGMGHEPFTNYLWPTEFLAWLRMLEIINQPANEAKIKLNNGLEMPQFGLGTFRSSVEQAHDAVLAALKAGYRHIDTAHAYQNERGVGAAIRESGIPREEIWITSKLWPTDYNFGNAAESINKMLERLGTDYIDLLYLHQAVGDYKAGWRGLEQAVKSGKVRAIGLSNFDVKEELFDDVLAKAEIKPAIVQIELHPYAQRKKFREKCAENNIAVEGWYPLGGTHGGNDVLFKDPVIQEIAGRYGKTPAEIILRWHVQEGFSTIPGSRNPEHIKQNIAVYNFTLSESDMNKIRALDSEKRFFTSTWEEIQRFNDWKPED
ncbi:MAG: aldo/keto reductase [Synergistaceae bacterium]|nr:aldo/keto reductase [Synergistaceae bacterium]